MRVRAPRPPPPPPPPLPAVECWALGRLFQNRDRANGACRFRVKKWNAVAVWSWNVLTDTCAICRNNLHEPSIEYQAQVRCPLPRFLRRRWAHADAQLSSAPRCRVLSRSRTTPALASRGARAATFSTWTASSAGSRRALSARCATASGSSPRLSGELDDAPRARPRVPPELFSHSTDDLAEPIRLSNPQDRHGVRHRLRCL